MLLVEGCSETGFLRHYLTTFFGAWSSKIRQVGGLSFFKKIYSKSNLNLEKGKKKLQIISVSEIIGSENVAISFLW